MERTSINVLLIDDSQFMQTVLQALTGIPNVVYSVDTVDGLPAALEYLNQQSPDVVCLNLSTTKTAAENVFNQIGSVNPSAALVAIAPDDETGVSQGIQAGAQAYILPDELNSRALNRILRDTLERKRSAIKLSQSEERLRIIFESVQDYAIFSTDPDGYIDSWNVGAERQFGYNETEIVGTRTDILFTPEDREAGIPQLEMQTAIEKGSASDDRWHLRKDGTTFFASGMTRPIFDTSGQLCGFSKICRDITEKKHDDDQRAELLRSEQEARAQADRANKLKDVFVGMISHELRTPLTSIIGFATTLTAEDVTWSLEDVREFIDIIYSEAQRMNELIEQLLDVSQQQSGTLRVRPEQRPFEYVLQMAMPQLMTLTRDHQFALDLPDELPVLMVDPHRLAQVFVNLVGNATKYSPAHSTITLAARQDGGFVQFEIADQGVGIPPEHQERIFDAFHQAANTTSARKGIGLGLTICRGIIEAHSGRIWLDSQPGRGSTFSFTIPVAPTQ